MFANIVFIFGTIAAGGFLGYIIGRFVARSDSELRIEDAYKKGKSEGEADKVSLTMALGEELLKLRSGIENVAHAYESTVRVMHERLGSAFEHGDARLLGSGETQLTLQFESKDPLGAAPRTDVEDENIQAVRHSIDGDDNKSCEACACAEFEDEEDRDNVVTSAVKGETVCAKNGHAPN